MKITGNHTCFLLLTLLVITFFATACSKDFQPNSKKELKKLSKETNKQRKRLPKGALKYFEGMQYIRGGLCVKSRIDEITAGKNDSTLLVEFPSEMDTVTDFFISDHEVTNAEYREFIDWVRDSIALSLLAEQIPSYYADKDKKILNWELRSEIYKDDSLHQTILSKMFYQTAPWLSRQLDTRKFYYPIDSAGIKIQVSVYPDTLIFLKDFSRVSNQPMTQMYFWHRLYKDFPVVGVTWQQAQAYCNWRSMQYNKAIDENNSGTTAKKLPYATFGLPAEGEWEYAAFALLSPYSDYRKIAYSRRIFPWDGQELKDEKGGFRAKFGEVFDQNNFQLKSYQDYRSIEAEYPCQTKSYADNDFRLYDMAGNVAEWTLEVPVRYRDSTSDLIFIYNYYYEHGSFKTKLKVDSDSIKKAVMFLRNSLYLRNQDSIMRDSLLQKRLNSDVAFTESKMNMHRDSFFSAIRPYVDSIRDKTAIDHTDNIVSACEKVRQRQAAYYRLISAILVDDTTQTDMDALRAAERAQRNPYYDDRRGRWVRVTPLDPILDSTSVRIKGRATGLDYREEIAATELQTAMVYYKNPNPRFVKGGSWANGPAYMVCGNREIFSENKCSSRIGFRVVMKTK
jgi:sulfatase modifying factor 1